ncbi:HTH-type transcriptional regulator Hpr [Clostridiales bacterium]|nr:HTH-type transcriptional regulator Hpr [Clostridiales bacterium]
MIDNNVFLEQLSKYYALWQEYNYVYEEWAKVHGMTVNSLLILYAIYEGGDDCTQKKISQRWMIPKQTTNMVLKDFEKNGLVELLPMSKDKRNKAIRFTNTGKEYAGIIISKLRKVELFVIEEIGIERMTQLNNNMALFIELFRKAGGDKNNETNI